MKKLIVLIAALVLLLLGAYVSYDYLTDTIHPNIDASDTTPNPATDFTFSDAKGNSVKLSEYYGKPIVLNFWASWCSPCKNEMPGFDELYAQYGDNVSFLMMNVTDGKRETEDSAKEYLTSNNYKFPVFFDTDQEGIKTYEVTGIPMTIVIDAKGNIKKIFRGEVSKDALEKVIESLVN